MRAIEVQDVSQVAEARRVAVGCAERHGFEDVDAGRVAIVATELATNLVKHGAGGTMLITSYDDDTGTGIECIALDRGSGMIDVGASRRDGNSSAGSPGNGLGAITRCSHFVDIYSAPGLGTAILARLKLGKPAPEAEAKHPVYGVVNIAMRGEEVCGDAWCKQDIEGGFTVMVADGLGHGPLAADASLAATRTFHQTLRSLPSDMLPEMHTALKPTRGAAIGIARIDVDGEEIVFAGVGNIAGTIVDGDGSVRRMVSNNGTIGHIAKHMRDFRYSLRGVSLVILASDGLATSWRLDAYPGLAQRHPALIAAVLYRDFNRGGRDDVTVFVARTGHP